MKATNRILATYGTTIFETMSQLARDCQSINLGQGFPDGNGPEEVVAAAAHALTDRSNQYPSMMGIPELRQAVADHDRHFYGLDIDWASETLVTSGGTEALTASLLALINPGDEVVLIEPLYDTYLPIIQLAGGVAKFVRVHPPEWRLDEAELRAAFSERTKLILFNTPMNPIAKVFTRAELELIAELVHAHDAYAICDEVYEHLSFDGRPHIPLMTLPGMRDRTVRIGSAGKTFSLTGWKVGYITAGESLIERIARSHQFLTFTTPPNLQFGVAAGLRLPDSYFTGIAADMQARRDLLTAGLRQAGFDVLTSAGTYFMIADIRSVGWQGDDMSFCRHITEKAGVTAIPVSAFYAPDTPAVEPRYARFCFAKSEPTLQQAVERLTRFFRP